MRYSEAKKMHVGDAVYLKKTWFRSRDFRRYDENTPYFIYGNPYLIGSITHYGSESFPDIWFNLISETGEKIGIQSDWLRDIRRPKPNASPSSKARSNS